MKFLLISNNFFLKTRKIRKIHICERRVLYIRVFLHICFILAVKTSVRYYIDLNKKSKVPLAMGKVEYGQNIRAVAKAYLESSWAFMTELFFRKQPTAFRKICQKGFIAKLMQNGVSDNLLKALKQPSQKFYHSIFFTVTFT